MTDDAITVLTIAAILIAPSIFHYAWLAVDALKEVIQRHRELHAYDSHGSKPWVWQ